MGGNLDVNAFNSPMGQFNSMSNLGLGPDNQPAGLPRGHGRRHSVNVVNKPSPAQRSISFPYSGQNGFNDGFAPPPSFGGHSRTTLLKADSSWRINGGVGAIQGNNAFAADLAQAQEGNDALNQQSPPSKAIVDTATSAASHVSEEVASALEYVSSGFSYMFLSTPHVSTDNVNVVGTAEQSSTTSAIEPIVAETQAESIQGTPSPDVTVATPQIAPVVPILILPVNDYMLNESASPLLGNWCKRFFGLWFIGCNNLCS
ncbi:hypothetical protein CY34DRAFT_19214 [Suillus luteus UH-Slu-Lm8-n1]|uniref:Uncharacterized protein n=1 Tax=Suillus luteus UH-Slu-Lm8-n1 TaxID=930992 RepID=A0A0C9Z459_9AGAM|nr:hypothetical protein CY34DRAFT_19214 [Suillus luteus UH-Slu-Lm8-n1]